MSAAAATGGMSSANQGASSQLNIRDLLSRMYKEHQARAAKLAAAAGKGSIWTAETVSEAFRTLYRWLKALISVVARALGFRANLPESLTEEQLEGNEDTHLGLVKALPGTSNFKPRDTMEQDIEDVESGYTPLIPMGKRSPSGNAEQSSATEFNAAQGAIYSEAQRFIDHLNQGFRDTDAQVFSVETAIEELTRLASWGVHYAKNAQELQAEMDGVVEGISQKLNLSSSDLLGMLNGNQSGKLNLLIGADSYEELRQQIQRIEGANLASERCKMYAGALMEALTKAKEGQVDAGRPSNISDGDLNRVKAKFAELFGKNNVTTQKNTEIDVNPIDNISLQTAIIAQNTESQIESGVFDDDAVVGADESSILNAPTYRIIDGEAVVSTGFDWGRKTRSDKEDRRNVERSTG